MKLTRPLLVLEREVETDNSRCHGVRNVAPSRKKVRAGSRYPSIGNPPLAHLGALPRRRVDPPRSARPPVFAQSAQFSPLDVALVDLGAVSVDPVPLARRRAPATRVLLAGVVERAELVDRARLPQSEDGLFAPFMGVNWSDLAGREDLGWIPGGAGLTWDAVLVHLPHSSSSL